MNILEIYEMNKALDKIYLERYSNVEELMDKNILSLLVEIGELANETKCFKYWSIKVGKKDEILEELADVLLMTLCFCNYLDVDITKSYNDLKMRTATEQFLDLYRLVSDFKENYTSEQILIIFGKVMTLGYSLGYNEEEIVKACHKKINKNIERLNSNY